MAARYCRQQWCSQNNRVIWALHCKRLCTVKGYEAGVEFGLAYIILAIIKGPPSTILHTFSGVFWAVAI